MHYYNSGPKGNLYCKNSLYVIQGLYS